jgi:hypothetical protein
MKDAIRLDHELKTMWSADLSDAKFDTINQVFNQISDINISKTLRSRLLDLEDKQASKSWTLAFKYYLSGVVTTCIAILLVLSSKSIFDKSSDELEIISDHEFVSLIDFEGDRETLDVLDPTLSEMEKLV